MEFICKHFQRARKNHLFRKYDRNFDIDELAKKYKLTIYYFDNQLFKSQVYGPAIFVMKKDDILIAHSNPGKLVKLPTGVNKIKGCKFRTKDILDVKSVKHCFLDSNWDEIERECGKGVNIWRKIGKGLNKSTIENLRRSEIKPAINLHCDQYFCKVFLITCDKLYFRGHRYLINQAK